MTTEAATSGAQSGHLPQPGEEAMFDLVFELAGTQLPRDYQGALWNALLEQLPWLAEEPGAGVHAVRGSATDAGLLLSRRARLALRLPQRRHADAGRLTGRRLRVEDSALEVGAARARPLEPFPTLSAGFVATGAGDELAHQDAVQALLAAMGLPLRFICGRMRVMRSGTASVAGASVVLHQLRPEQSLLVQCRGLGELRHLGCGLFLPHKTISGID